MLFFGTLRGGWASRALRLRPFVLIGGMCYTIYLIHLPLCEAMMMLTRGIQVTDIYEVNLLIQLLLFLPVVFVVGSVSFLLFEKPFMNKDWPKALFGLLRVKQAS